WHTVLINVSWVLDGSKLILTTISPPAPFPRKCNYFLPLLEPKFTLFFLRYVRLQSFALLLLLLTTKTLKLVFDTYAPKSPRHLCTSKTFSPLMRSYGLLLLT